ncbi:MAG: serine/threonine-protein kinase [Myxococcota bacterium]
MPTLDTRFSTEVAPDVEELIEAKVMERLFATESVRAQIGRFQVLEEIGRGGMGTVYAAYDEQLDRKVAVKVMRVEHSDFEAQQRFQREAQAMARLSHPNVVTVHEVGHSAEQVFLAMEFIRGQSLDQWIHSKPGWPQVLEVFVQAGRGLMAAHEAGLVHRDLKPHNIMRGEDGVVKVLDFGLARTRSDQLDEPTDARRPSGSSSILSSPLTLTGTVMGTPAYMAPEQFVAGPIDARSDQFSFCVAFFEALYNERPYENTSKTASMASASRGAAQRSRSLMPDARVPRWLLRVVLRGLEPMPGDRWPSMAALLAALDRGQRRSQWRRRFIGLAVLVLCVGMAIAVQQQHAREQRERIAACDAEGAAIDEIWNDGARGRLEAGLLATGVGFAQKSIDTLTPWLDDYRDAWRSGRVEACMHGSVDRDWDPTLLDRSMWCFEDRRLQLEATIDQIATATPKAARRAVRIASYLDPVETCLDPGLLRRLPTPPAEIRDEIRAIRAILVESDGLRHAGRYTRALEVARRAAERAEPLGWPPVLAAARFLEGLCLRAVGRYAEADVVLTRAYFEAQEAGMAEVAFRSARALIPALTSLWRYREAEIWSRHANVLSFQLSDPSRLDEAEGHYLLIEVYRGLGDYGSAAAEGERALSLRAEALGADHPITAAAMRNLGRVYLLQERFVEALTLFERSLVVWEDAVGHEHPYIGELAVLRGRALLGMGKVDEALALMEYGRAVYERVLRADHPMLAQGLAELGRVYLALGRLEDAERMHNEVMTRWRSQTGHRARRVAQGLLNLSAIDLQRGDHPAALERCMQALERLEGTLGSGILEFAVALERCADVELEMGRIDDAIERRRDALARRESMNGSGDRQLMTPLVRLGDTLRAGAEPSEARRAYERALAIAQRVAGEEDCTLVPSLVGLAQLALEQGAAASASRLAERGGRIVETGGCGPRLAADAHFVRARALVAAGNEHVRARSLAEQARAEYTTTYDGAGVAAVDEWLARNDGGQADDSTG